MGLPEESAVFPVVIIIRLPETVGSTVDEGDASILALEFSPVALTLEKVSEMAIVFSRLVGDVATVLVECLKMDGNSVNVMSLGSSTRLSSSISLSPEDGGTSGPADEEDDDGFALVPPSVSLPALRL